VTRYVRHSIADIETVINAVLHRVPDNRTLINGVPVGVASLRMRTFAKKGTCCKYCGLQATHFAVEKCAGSKQDIYHVNLWGVLDGREVLFTHDHVHARSLSGADDLNNSVTACENCNSKKSKFENKIRLTLPKGTVKIKFKTLKKMIEEKFLQDHIRNFFFIET